MNGTGLQEITSRFLRGWYWNPFEKSGVYRVDPDGNSSHQIEY